MDYERLLEKLGIDSGEEFEYFENFSDLVESDEHIGDEALCRLFRESDRGTVAEIMENYFNELMDSIPDDSTDIYTLMETIRMALIGLIESGDEDTVLVHFCQELDSFIDWYCRESQVECRNMESGVRETVSLRDALVLARLEKLQGDRYMYDFSGCLDYELEEYVLTFADLARAERADSSDDMFEESYDDYDENIYDR